MGKTKPRGKYQGVSLPVDFIQEIKTHIMKDDKYKSIAEFIKESIREKMEKEKYWANYEQPLQKVDEYPMLTDEEIKNLSPKEKREHMLKIAETMEKHYNNYKRGLELKEVHQKRITKDKKKGETIIPVSESQLREMIEIAVKETLSKEKKLSEKKKEKNGVRMGE